MKLKKEFLKKVFAFLTLLMLLITFFNIKNTYALFESQTDNMVNATLGKWVIKINDKNIVDGRTEKIELTGNAMAGSSLITLGRIAPGFKGSLDMVLNASECSVSVRYDITINEFENSVIKVKSVTDVFGDGNIIKTGENTYSGVILLKDLKKLEPTLRVIVEWEYVDDPIQNELDISIAKNNDWQITIPIDVEVTQYFGEELVEYVPPVDDENIDDLENPDTLTEDENS